MLLLVGILIFIVVAVVSAPATNDVRRGREHYWELRRQDAEFFRQQAEQNDTYYHPNIFGTNDDFYNDGSLRRDVTTGKTYNKGQYYCRADGVKADYSKADSSIPRPPK